MKSLITTGTGNMMLNRVERSPLFYFVLLFILLFIPISAKGLTRSAAVDWAEAQDLRSDNSCNTDGINGLQCCDLATAYANFCWLRTNNDYRDPWCLYPYTTKYGREYDEYLGANPNWIVIERTESTVPEPGDLFVSEQDSGGHGWGHVGIVLSANGSTGARIIEMGDGVGPAIKTINWAASGSYKAEHFVRFIYFDDNHGTLMTEGYNPVLPNGDYIIAAAANPRYYLDIPGTAFPAENQSNVHLWSVNDTTLNSISSGDTWSISYNPSDKFYTIKQKGTNMCLEVADSGILQGKNIQVSGNNAGAGQKWAISRNENKGFQIQAKCSGYAVSTSGTIANDKNIEQRPCNHSNAQSWVFIPYLPSQPVEEGRYIVLFESDSSYELDVAGDTGEIENNTNVRIWSDTCPSQYNSFDFIKLSNGYYKVKHAASGKCLDVTGWSTTYHSNVAVYDDNGSATQQWAVVSNGSGYSLISRCNGYALILPYGETGDGKNVDVYPPLQNGEDPYKQRWTFVPAEYTVTYNTGSTETILPQTKYYKTDLILSDFVPEYAGYAFAGWAPEANASVAVYQPGDTYTADADVTLYPIWENRTFTVCYDPNTTGMVTNLPENQEKVSDEDLMLAANIPSRSGFTFEGWGLTETSIIPTFQPGDAYTTDANIILYAIWRSTNAVLPSGMNIGRSNGGIMYCSIPGPYMAVINYPITKPTLFRVHSLDESGTWYRVSYKREFLSEPEHFYREETYYIRANELTILSDADFNAKSLSLPAGTRSIESEAFSNLSGTYAIHIPGSVDSISNDAFSGTIAVIFAPSGSYAANWADQHGYWCVAR